MDLWHLENAIVLQRNVLQREEQERQKQVLIMQNLEQLLKRLLEQKIVTNKL